MENSSAPKSSPEINPLLPSNFFGTKIFINAPTTKTVMRKFLLPKSILLDENKSIKSKNLKIHAAAALAAILFSSIAASSGDGGRLVEAQKPGPSSPFSQNLSLTAPKPQAQPVADIPDGSQRRKAMDLAAPVEISILCVPSNNKVKID